MIRAMDSGSLGRLESDLDYRFKIELIVEALTHSSYKNEHRTTLSYDNERLEFLGDTALGLCVAELLFRKYPQATEGAVVQIKITTGE